jgi:hypothetical protein
MCWVRRFGFSTVTAPPRSLGLEYERLAAQQKAQKLVGELAKCKKVSRPFPSWSRCMLTEISLWHACSYHEMLRAETAGQDAAIVSAQLALLRGRAGLTTPAASSREELIVNLRSSEQQGGGAGAGGGGGRGLGARRAHSMDEILEQGREGSEGGRLSPPSTRQADPLFDHFYLTAQGLLVRYVTIRTVAVTDSPYVSAHPIFASSYHETRAAAQPPQAGGERPRCAGAVREGEAHSRAQPPVVSEPLIDSCARVHRVAVPDAVRGRRVNRHSWLLRQLSPGASAAAADAAALSSRDKDQALLL